MADTNTTQRILLCVTGLSPQVVTESVYALAVRDEWVADEVKLITTKAGAERARLSLLSQDPGWMARLQADYGLPPVHFDEQDILTIPDADGLPLEDIRSPEDNERAADFILETVRELTSDAHTELHVSIAGGRKTMGFYLGYALTLYGRPQDRLSHVLVSAPYESCWDFFYPTPYEKVIQTADKNLVDARQARITLAEIPYVSLRHGVPEHLLTGQARFAETVAAVRRSMAPPELVLDLEGRQVMASGVRVRLAPTRLALLSVFARRRIEGQGAIEAPNKEVPDNEWAERFLREYHLARGAMGDTDRTEATLSNGMSGDYFSQTKSKLEKDLEKRLGSAVAAVYRIKDNGKHPKQFSLDIPAEAIRYAPIEAPD